jgi:bifunctional non-homologous end joining protein LigD
MLATLVDAAFSDPEWVFEPKYDGVRALAYVQGGRLRLVTRRGNDVTFRYPDLKALVRCVRGDAILDGEIIALDERGHSKFQLLQQRLGLLGRKEIEERARRWPAKFAVFDILWSRGRDLRALPLAARRLALERVVRGRDPVLLSPQVRGRGDRAFREAFRRGLEGVIAKRADSAYRAGRSHDWLKIKTTQRQEVVLGGWTDPRGSRPVLGALVAGLYGPDGRLHWIGNIGTGFMLESLKQLQKVLRPLSTPESPFAGPVRSREAVHWVRPKLVCEVRFGEWTRDGRMRVPVFQGLRDDKKPEDCRLERPQRARSLVRAARARRA